MEGVGRGNIPSSGHNKYPAPIHCLFSGKFTFLSPDCYNRAQYNHPPIDILQTIINLSGISSDFVAGQYWKHVWICSLHTMHSILQLQQPHHKTKQKKEYLYCTCTMFIYPCPNRSYLVQFMFNIN